MASFTRGDYEDVFDFARTVWQSAVKNSKLEREAIKIMDLCEGVIGQMSHRPRESRRPDEA